MNTLGNNNKHTHLAKLAYSAGRVCLALAFALVITGGVAQAAPLATAPGLGSAANFAVLSAAPDAGGAVTLTNSTVTGDVGSSGLWASVTKTNSTINGAVIAPVFPQVLTDFNNAYDAFPLLPCEVLTGTLDGVTLTPGVYCFDAAAELTGVLTLNGPSNGIWIFEIGTSGTGYLEATNFSVVMADGTPVPCNSVTWWVAQYAELTDSNFAGTILAGTYITITRGTFTGDALAKAGVTLTDANLTGCEGGKGNGHYLCNQGVGNGPESCDPGNSNQGDLSRSNDELGGTPKNPGRKGGNGK
jgi:hypothetical protein